VDRGLGGARCRGWLPGRRGTRRGPGGRAVVRDRALPDRGWEPSHFVINSLSTGSHFGCFPWSEAYLGGAIQSLAHSISREGGDGWALFGRVFERVSESLLKGSGALMTVTERLVRTTIGWVSRVNTDWTPAGTASASAHPDPGVPSRGQLEHSQRLTAERTDQHPRNVADGRIPGHHLPLAPADHTDPHRTDQPLLAEIHLVPTDGSSRHTQLQQVASRCGGCCHAHNTLLQPRGDRLLNPKGHPLRSLRLRPRSPAEACDRMSTNRPRRQSEFDRRVHTCGERGMRGLR
jgi:hypothetical protein